MGILAVFSVADASIVVALIGLIATYITTRRNRKDIKQINKAVNHVGDGEPTLIQRVKRLEARSEKHAEWESAAFKAIADQIGVQLPERPAVESEQAA